MFNKISVPQVSGTETNYLTHKHDLRSWLLTRDHKRVAILYLGSIIFFLILGGIAAGILRLELFTPQADLVSNATYRKAYTMHGLLMVFFCVVPAVPAILGNFLVPLMIGAKNVAFPRLNLLSWYFYLLAGVSIITVTIGGGIDGGWGLYMAYNADYANAPLLLTAASLAFVSISSILVALNFVVTIHKMRAPGMTWFRLPLFVWSIYITSFLVLLATPILLITIFLVAMEEQLQLSIFDPASGGDPRLYQHLFWFYGNQVAYIIILPAIGIIFEIVAAFTHRRIFSYRYITYALMAIAYLSLVTWARHMLPGELSPTVAIFASLFSFLFIVPFSIILFSLVSTLYKGTISLDSPMLFVLGSIGLTVIGGLAGMALSALALAEHLHGTYFVTAHVHFAVAAALMAGLGGLHFWWPKITGRSYPEFLAGLAATILFVGSNITLLSIFILGYLGMPRHAHAYPEEFGILQAASTLGASILVIGYILPVVYLSWSTFFGRKATNPWQAKGLEWEQTSSPPAAGNFHHTPIVTDEAYAYPLPASGSSSSSSQEPAVSLLR